MDLSSSNSAVHHGELHREMHGGSWNFSAARILHGELLAVCLPLLPSLGELILCGWVDSVCRFSFLKKMQLQTLI